MKGFHFMKTIHFVKTYGLFLLFMAALAAAALTLPEPSPGFYGVARAPHSDALTSWLHGTLGFYFEGTSGNTLLLRPTVAVVYASILTLTGDIGAVPTVFIALLCLGLLTGFLLADRAGRWALTATAAAFWWSPPLTFLSTAPDSLNTDFPALACTVTGLLLALSPTGVRRGDDAARAAGWLLLGWAAAVRGPMLAAAPALLCLQLLLLRRATGDGRSALIRTGLCAAAFLVPVIGDSALRAAVGAVGSQGLMAFYCFYADPAHTLTNETYFRYMELKPSAAEVIKNYLAFLISDAGLAAVRDMAAARLTTDAGFIRGLHVVWPVMAGFTVGLIGRLFRRGAGVGIGALDVADMTVGAALIGLLFAADLGRIPAGWGLAAALATAMLWSAARGRTVPAGLAAAYLAGTAFLVLTGTAGYDRVSFTYFICAPAALLWAAWACGGAAETKTEAPSAAHGATAGVAGGAVILAAVLATTADSLIMTPMKAAWRTEAAGRSAAIKISDAPALDRSLYYSGRGEILYTRRDEREIGAVVRYRRFDNPNGDIGDPDQLEGLRGFNALFHKPGAFIE
jgi:hypothetical protein